MKDWCRRFIFSTAFLIGCINLGEAYASPRWHPLFMNSKEPELIQRPLPAFSCRIQVQRCLPEKPAVQSAHSRPYQPAAPAEVAAARTASAAGSVMDFDTVIVLVTVTSPGASAVSPSVAALMASVRVAYSLLPIFASFSPAAATTVTFDKNVARIIAKVRMPLSSLFLLLFTPLHKIFATTL